MNDFTLLIINCQNDFTTSDGVTYIPKTEKTIPKICNFIIDNKENINRVIFACDNHPTNHCSFKGHGGGWPAHCVQDTFGAKVNSELLKTLRDLNIDFVILNKGEVFDFDEYSAAMYSEHIDGMLVLKTATDACRVRTNDIVVCGCAGDFSVKDTLLDLCKYAKTKNIYAFLDGIASIDDNTQLMNLLEDKTELKIV